MIKNVLEEVGGIGLYGVISICLFFMVFSGALVWALLHRKGFCATMSAMPLADDEPKPSN